MEGLQISWIFSGVAGLVALFFFVRSRSESERVTSLARDVDHLEGELRASRAQLEKASAERRRSSEKESEARRKLEKVKKRASKSRDDEKEDLPGTIRRLEGQLRLRSEDLERTKEELARVVAAASSTGPSTKEMAAEKATQEAVDQLTAAERELPELRDRTARAEAAARESAEVAEKSSKESTRYRHKSITQDKLYNSMRLELEAKKDMLRTQTEELERLRAFKVVLGAGADAEQVESAAERNELTAIESAEEASAEAAVLAEMEQTGTAAPSGDEPISSS
jgi:chromosome segregation ATPase